MLTPFNGIAQAAPPPLAQSPDPATTPTLAAVLQMPPTLRALTLT